MFWHQLQNPIFGFNQTMAVMAVVGIEIVREGEGSGCCRATVPAVLQCPRVRGVKGLLGLNPLGLISRLLRGQVNLSI